MHNATIIVIIVLAGIQIGAVISAISAGPLLPSVVQTDN